MITKKRISFILAWIILIIAAFIIRGIELKGANGVVTLAPAPALSGAISQSLASSTSGNSVPVVGKNYNLKSSAYFEAKTWAVVGVAPANQSTNTAYVVLHQTNGAYQVILGPGTAFSSSSVQNLPGDVVQYLKNSGVLIYTPSGGQ